jgi:hypothetical protein
MADLSTKILHSCGSNFNATIAEKASTFKCYKDGSNYKMVIELTIDEKSSLKLLGEIKGSAGTVLSNDELNKDHGWIYFEKSEKDPIQIMAGSGHFISDKDDTVSLNLVVSLGGGKTQSAQ